MKRKQRFIVFNIVALGLFAVLGGILESLASTLVPTAYLHYVWPALGVVALATMGLSIWQYRLQEDNEQLPLNIQNRLRLIEKVRAFWIKGVLEQSLHNAALITLGLHEQPDAVANPWRLVLEQLDHTPRPLPEGTRITQVYDDAGGELLILGEPGSGKTTLLLELARDLLDRAKKDDKIQIPIVFNLSSWAVKRSPLANWLIEELYSKYQVPRKLGQSWVEGNQILPLLDGLDEMKSEYREDCVKAINAYRGNHGIVPIVVCSRTTEYLTQKSRALLRFAVVVQPLTELQVDDYLASAGGQLAAIRVALRQDAVLRELATTPLMLSILTLAYHGISVQDILADSSLEKRRQQVFETYIQRMLRLRNSEHRYRSQYTIQWLAWLGRQMAEHKLTEFYIERIQPDWLANSRSRYLYSFVVVKVFVSIVGFICGLMFGIIFFSNLVVSLILGLVGMIAALIYFWRKGAVEDAELKSAEVISWSWENMWKEIVQGLRSDVLYGIILGIIFFLTSGLFRGILGFLGTFLVCIVYDGLLGGITNIKLDNRKISLPNQGIRLSARNSLFTGLVVGVVLALIGIVLIDLKLGLYFGLIGLLAGGLVNGADACFDHFALRFLLWRAGSMPLNYPRFLDFATDHILLRKVGGGYIFTHRLLLEYFASLDTAPSTKFARSRRAIDE